MAFLVPMCNNIPKCAFCKLNADQSTWKKCEVHAEKRCSSLCMGIVWKYDQVPSDEMIRVIHKANAPAILEKCEAEVKDFYKNATENTGTQEASNKLARYLGMGCHFKRYFVHLLNRPDHKDAFDMIKMVQTASVETILYYFDVSNGFAPGMYDIRLIKTLCAESRFDVLDALITTDRIMNYDNRYVSTIIKHYMESGLDLNDEIIAYLAKYFKPGMIVDKIMLMCLFEMYNYSKSFAKLTQNHILDFINTNKSIATLARIMKRQIADLSVRKRMINSVVDRDNFMMDMKSRSPKLAEYTINKILETVNA